MHFRDRDDAARQLADKLAHYRGQRPLVLGVPRGAVPMAAIIAEAAFSFIGLGAQPPTPSLGAMIADGRNYILLDHWISTIPGVTIVIIVVALNLLGDGLRDMFDPRLRNR